jgi:hypothetical protein
MPHRRPTPRLPTRRAQVTDANLFTGLAEYRNGGLFIDMGVIKLRNPEHLKMHFDVGSELVVEWRALTVVLIDMVLDKVCPLARAANAGRVRA